MALADARYSLLRRRLFRWHRQNLRSFPWRETNDPYRVLIGEILLQRTRGENVVVVYETFTTRWPDVEHLAAAPIEELRAAIQPLGLTKRASSLAALAARLGSLGKVPSEPHELARLPGVGPYVSHAVPIFAKRRNLPLVDWVIARVLRRYFDLPDTLRPNADQQLWRLAAELIHAGRAREVWLGVLDLAAAICTTRPHCGVCPLRASCAYSTGAAAT